MFLHVSAAEMSLGLCADPVRLLLQTEKIDAKCITWQEANMKMKIADLIFDDLVEDTALAFSDAFSVPVTVV